MTMGPVGERFARTPRQFDTGKHPLRSDSLFAVNPERKLPTRYSPTAIILLLVSSVSYAQNVPSERQEIQQLVLQINALQERVRVLESQQGANSTPNTEPPVQAVSPPTVRAAQNDAPPSAASIPEVLHDLHGIQWRGFGEVNYKVLNQRTPELGTYGFVPGS